MVGKNLGRKFFIGKRGSDLPAAVSLSMSLLMLLIALLSLILR